jgi:hypothetical protein
LVTRVSLNGQSFYFDPGTINNINVNLGGGNDQINIGALTGETVNITLGSGNDTVNVGGTAGTLDVIDGTVNINGGANPTLIVNDHNGLSSRTWNVTGSSISNGNVAINYNGQATNVVLDGSKVGGNSFKLSPTVQYLDELPGSFLFPFTVNSSLTIDGGGLGSSLILNDQHNAHASSWSVTGNNVTRSYKFNSAGTLFEDASINYSNMSNLTLHGGNGNDTFTLSPTAKDLDELPGAGFFNGSGAVTVAGGTGSNTLVLNDQNNANGSDNWDVTGSSVTRSFVSSGLLHLRETATIDYSGVANLDLNGSNAGGNVFTLSSTAHDLDELPGTAVTSIVSFGSQTSLQVNGGGGENTLVLNDQNNAHPSSWTVSGGSVTRSYGARVGFFNETVTSTINYGFVSNLVLNAGNGNDTFTLSPSTHNLDELPGAGLFDPGTVTVAGGTGSNSLVVDDQNNSVASSWTVTSNSVQRSHQTVGLFKLPVTATIDYSNMANLALNGGSGGSTLQGPNTTNTWNITGANAGSLNGNVSFSAMQNLVGGTGVDTFEFTAAASQVASINGGGAPTGQGNWLDYSAYPAAVTVNLATGKATGVTGTVSNIQNVIGGNHGATLTGNAQGNILIGGSGGNAITGGTGASLLIGGKGNDTVTGGSGGDILIGGNTVYDQAHNEAALMSILAEWQSANPYATRVSHLKAGGGLNGSNTLVLGTTVIDDGSADSLTGGSHIPGALDWFFQGVHDTIHNLEAGEQIN